MVAVVAVVLAALVYGARLGGEEQHTFLQLQFAHTADSYGLAPESTDDAMYVRESLKAKLRGWESSDAYTALLADARLAEESQKKEQNDARAPEEIVPAIPQGPAMLLDVMSDGYPIYSSAEFGRELTSSDLDACSGHTHEIFWRGYTQSLYHYHAIVGTMIVAGCVPQAIAPEQEPGTDPGVE